MDYYDEERIIMLEAEIERLRFAAEQVCWFDWTGNDEDAVTAINNLRAALRANNQQEQKP